MAEENLEDRVENLFAGDMVDEPEEAPEFDEHPEVEEVEASEEAEETVEAVEEEAEPVVEIEIDGEVLEVPEKYKDYFLRQADYTQKTTELASQRKQVEVNLGQIKQAQEQFAFAESIREDVAKAQKLEGDANQYHEYLRANIDNLSSTDIEKLRLAIDDARRERDQIVQSVQGRYAEFQQAQEQSLAEILNKGTEVLRQRIPGWGEQQQKQVRDYALANGFSEAEISQVVDPRQVEILFKASQYDALKAGAAPAVKKVQQAPSIKQKSRNPMPEDVKDKLNLRKKLKNPKLSSRDKARAIQEAMGERFG